jgi:Cof subfamily protein (haloacid dehalogenase superfamily)
MKIFAFDIDQTLIDDTFESDGKTYVVYPEVVSAINSLLAEGNVILFASGRPYSGIAWFMRHFTPSPNVYCASANGATLYDHEGKVLGGDFLTIQDFYRVSAAFGGHDDFTYMCYFLDDKVGYLHKANFAPTEAAVNFMDVVDLNGLTLDPKIPIQKAFVAVGEHHNTYQMVVPADLERDYSAVRSSSFFIEFMNKNVSKGRALERLGKLLRVSKDAIYAFGDGDNDTAMLEVGHGVAMGNATPGCKQAAEFVTKTAAERGIVYALKEHFGFLI